MPAAPGDVGRAMTLPLLQELEQKTKADYEATILRGLTSATGHKRSGRAVDVPAMSASHPKRPSTVKMGSVAEGQEPTHAPQQFQQIQRKQIGIE